MRGCIIHVILLVMIGSINAAIESIDGTGIARDDVKKSGMAHDHSRESGMAHDDPKELGMSHDELEESGMSHDDLKDSGMSHDEMKDSGMSHDELKELGLAHDDIDVENDDVDDDKSGEKTNSKTSQEASVATKGPKTKIIVKKPTPDPYDPYDPLMGLEWWQLLLIVLGSCLGLLFLCICCCAVMDSAHRQEVRGANGERLGFFQAPGRHIILVMDSRMSRFRGNQGAAAGTTGAPAMQAATVEGATPTTTMTNPPHAPNVQPIYPKV